jgi:creatinine amidohydrolase
VQHRYWQDLTTTDFAAVDTERTVGVLPVAAVEQHGPHLPLATDALINEALLRETLPQVGGDVRVLVLPAFAIGASLEHTAFAGTLTIAPPTLLSVWLDVGRSVARAGLRKLLILNTHGGQKSLVDLAAVQLRAELGMLVVRGNYFALGAPPGLFDEREVALGIHGGELETSLLLHIRPDLVRSDALEDFGGLPAELAEREELLGVEKPVGFGWMSQDLGPAGVCGNAAAADADRGRRYLAYLAERLARLLDELGRFPLGVIGGR